MIKDEAVPLIKGINFCIKTGKYLLIVGITASISAFISGLYSVDLQKILMTVSTFAFLALAVSGTMALKLSSSLPEGDFRELTRDLSWRWKPWISIALGLMLFFASVGFSV